MVFRETKLVIKNKNQTSFHNNKNNNRKKEVETGTSSSINLFQLMMTTPLETTFSHLILYSSASNPPAAL